MEKFMFGKSHFVIMRKIIEMPYENSKVLVAVDVPDEQAKEEIRRVGALDWLTGKPEPVGQDFGKITDMIIKYSKPIVKSFEEISKETIPPKKASVEFGLSFGAKGNIYLVEASGEASIKISIEWDF